MRWFLCAAVWVLSAIVALTVAARTRIGPTVIQLSPNHGVHAGDVLAVLSAVTFSTLFTVAAWRLGDRRLAPSGLDGAQ